MTDELLSVPPHAAPKPVLGRRHRRSKLALTGLLVLCIAALAACGGGSGGDADVETGDWGGVINPGGEPVSGGTLSVALQAEPPGISPLYFLFEVPDQQTIKVMMQMFDQLVELRPGSLDPQPGLAKSWEVSEDGLTYTFRLRDAEFSNGMPVTAADVQYSIDQVRGPKSFFVDLFTSISAVKAPDDHTVVIELSEPAPALLNYLAFPGASIVPAKVVKEEGVEAFNEQPIGSGPFKLEEWQRDQQVVLTRNENYWREGQPYLDEVRLISTPDDNARVLNVESGTVGASDQIPFGQIERIDSGGTARVLVATAAETYAVTINNGKPPYDELAVRKALNYATPVDSIVDTVFHGQAERANSLLPKLKYWTEEAEPYPYDLDEARAQLQQSSVPDGFTARLAIDPNSQISRQVGQILQESWGKIGIDLKLIQPDEATLTDAFLNGTYELLLGAPGGGMSDVPVEDEFAQFGFDSPETHNLYTFSEKTDAAREGRRLVRQATRELDEARRAELFADLHVLGMREPGGIPLIFTPNTIAVANDVHNLNYVLTGWFLLDGVWVGS